MLRPGKPTAPLTRQATSTLAWASAAGATQALDILHTLAEADVAAEAVMAAAVQRRAATRRRRAAAARTRMRAKREGGAAAGFPAAGTRGSGGNGVSPERGGRGPVGRR